MSADRPFPDPLPWSSDVLEFTQQLSEALRRSVVQVPSDSIANAATAALRHYEAVIKPTFQKTLEDLHRMWLRATPDNWHELGSGELDVVDLVQESGICIIWAPRAAIVEALIATGKTERYQELAARSDAVLDDLDDVLARARGADARGHDEACAFAAEAMGAARDGHWNAAQALAASGLGQVIHGMVGYPPLGGLGAAYKRFSGRDVEEATMEILKVSLLEVCTARALTDYGCIRPEGFNRHATQHGDREFFSQANSLAGLLLLVGWIREFAWIAENHPEVLTDDEQGHREGQAFRGQE